MIEIVDLYGGLMSLPPYGGELESGYIVNIITIGSDLYFTLSTYRNPFGVVISTSDETGLVYVACSLFIFKTDIFEEDQCYKKGDLLYSNNYGIFTTRKVRDDAIPIGIVNIDRTGRYIECRLI